MNREVEYQLFVEFFHARHGYLQPPSYAEWLYNQNAHVANNSRTTWSSTEQSVLVNSWKENFDLLNSIQRSEAWQTIHSSVCSVGGKTLKQCKDKIRNLKDQYKEAKDKNRRSGESLHQSPYFKIFDEILGVRDVVTMPNVTQVGASTPPSTATGTPTRQAVEEVLKKGRKRKASEKDRQSELKNYLEESEKRQDTFLSNLVKQQIDSEKEEREKDRAFFLELFSKK